MITFGVFKIGDPKGVFFYVRLLCSYLSLVSASLLLSEMYMIVLPPSSITGYLLVSEPVNSFESGILNE
jgi:hypothetical protein